MYEKGRGVAQDYTAAAQWYRKTADQGLAIAQLGIGELYEQGHGVPPDSIQAMMWFRLAAAGSSAGNEEHNEAAEHMNKLATKMTPAQLEEAKRLAREWKPINK